MSQQSKRGSGKGRGKRSDTRRMSRRSENALRRRGRRIAKEARQLLRKRKKHLPEAVSESIRADAEAIRAALRRRPRDLRDMEELATTSKRLDESLEEHIARYRKSVTREYVESILWAVAIALFIRAFFFEAFQIPSGSMLPTLHIGDHIFVSKYLYGIRLPWTHIRFFDWRTPLPGEVVVFEYPGPGKEHGTDFIKRVVGVAGDRVRLQGNRLFINGKPLFTYPMDIHSRRAAEAAGVPPVLAALGRAFLPRDWDRLACRDVDEDRVSMHNQCACTMQYERNGAHGYITQHYALPCSGSPDWPRARAECAFGALPEDCLYHGARATNPNWPDVVIDRDTVFCMGDNRDNSADGRTWGFVPLENVKGKAFVIWWPVSRMFGLVH